MARSIRIEFPGAFYHVMARGNRREAIFFGDEDREWFLKTLGEACAKTGWRVHAWVLMDNHYHLMMETPEANLVEGMKWLQNTFTRRFNTKHRSWGRVFGDRYKAIVVEGRAPFYFETLWDYIHLNPVRAGIIRPGHGQSVLDYRWSSVSGGYALPASRRPRWLAAGEALGMFGLPDSVAGRRRLVERLDRRAVDEHMERCGVPPLPAEADAPDEPSAARVVLGKPAVCREPENVGGKQWAEPAFARVSWGGGAAQSRDEPGAGVVGGGVAAGATSAGVAGEAAWKRLEEGGHRAADRCAYDREPSMVGGESRDAKRGQREPVAAHQGRAGGGKAFADRPAPLDTKGAGYRKAHNLIYAP